MIRVLNMVALITALILAAALYVAKNDVKHAQLRLINLQEEVMSARAAVLLLENEEAYLESPQRLARLARDHLGLIPITAEHEQEAGVVLAELRMVRADMMVEPGQ